MSRPDVVILTPELLIEFKDQIERHVGYMPSLAEVEAWARNTVREPRRGVTPGGIEWRSYR